MQCMTDPLQKCWRWEWSAICEQAFNSVKSLLCDDFTMRPPDFKRLIVLAVDASWSGGCPVAGGRRPGGANRSFLLQEAHACTQEQCSRTRVFGHLLSPSAFLSVSAFANSCH